MDGWRNEILFFPGEDAEALKSRFVDVCAYHQMRFSFFEVAQYVFKDLREPTLRAGKAAEVWGNDLDVIERVRIAMLKGKPGVQIDAGETDLIARSLQIADDPRVDAKDRISAIRLAGELQGFVKKSVEAKIVGKAVEGANDFLAALSARLPA